MRTSDIIKEIQQLSISQRIYVVEKTMHSIRKLQEKDQMRMAAEELYSEYTTNKALTEFTNIDFEDFYEAK